MPHRLDPLRLPATNGHRKNSTSDDLCAEGIPNNAKCKEKAIMRRESHKMEDPRGVLPQKSPPDRKNAEQMKCETLKPLGDILPSRPTAETITAEVKTTSFEPPQDCTTHDPVSQIAIRDMIDELQQLKDHLKDVKARQCSKTKNNTNASALDSTKDQDVDQGKDPLKYVKAIVNDMNVMVTDIDLDMSCVQQAAKEIVESMVERLKKSKDDFDETLLKHEKEILRLQGVNNETQYLLVEGDAKFKSLEKAMDLTNEEYEKLQKQNSELLAEKLHFESEYQKINDDMMFRAKELGSEELLEQNKRLAAENDKLVLEATFRARELTNLHYELQRRDQRSSELLEEYHVLWKDKNTLYNKAAALEAELEQSERARLRLHEHNSDLGCQIAAMEDQIQRLQNHNAYLAGASDEFMPNEPETSTNSVREIEPDDVEMGPEGTDPQQTSDVLDIGIKEHVLFVENGKIINGLAEISKPMPTAALDAMKEVEKRAHEVAENVAALDIAANEIPSLEVESSNSAQKNSGTEMNEPAAIQPQANEKSPEDLAENMTGNKQEEQHAAVPQDSQPNALHLDWVIQQQNNQLKELQTIIGILREKNAQLEKEKVEIISEHQGFLLENMQEVKRLQKLEESLNEKERMIQDNIQNGSKPRKSKLQLKEDENWFEECVKASNRVQQIESLMAKQDKMLSDLQDDRDRLLKVNKDLRVEMAKMHAEDAMFLGLPKPLQGIEDIVKQLRKSKVICNGVRKKIRCYTRCNVAIQELRRMKPDTVVISIGDITPNEDGQPPPKAPVTREQILIKKSKMIKRHRMKNMQNQLFQNPSAMGSAPGGSGGAAFPGGMRPRHKRVNT